MSDVVHQGGLGPEHASIGSLPRFVSAKTGLLAAGALAVLMPVVTGFGLDVPGRTLLALCYALLLPGLPLARLLGLPSRLASACLVVALSLAVQALVCVALLQVNLFNGLIEQILISSVTLGFIVPAIRRSPEQRLHRLVIPAPSQWLSLALAELRRSWSTALGLTAALLLWAFSVASNDPTGMNGYGFISVVGWSFPVAVLLLALTTVNELRRAKLRAFWLTALVASFFIILQGTMSVVEPVASIPVSRLHLAFAEYIQDHGSGLVGVDARFSWPGFFSLLASVTTASGLPDAGDFLRWAPLAQNLLIVLPLVLLGRSIASSQRVIWLAAILYACGNWYGQDYLSPQALALFFALTVIALLAWSTLPPAASGVGDQKVDRRRWSLPPYLRRPVTRRPARVDGLSSSRSVWLFGAILLILAATVVTHQLTPMVLILDLVVFAFVRRTRFRGLWIIMALMTTAWISYGATDYWPGHLDQMFGGIGRLGATVDIGVNDRMLGTSEHQAMLYVRIGLSALFVLLTVVGVLWVRRTNNTLLTLGLALAPFGLIAVQSYGGEIFVRCFIFALPVLSIGSAEALAPLLTGRGFSRVVLVSVLSIVSVMLVAARGANAGFERITTSQLAAVGAIDAAAESDVATVASLNSFTPLGQLPFDRFRTKIIGPATCGGAARTPTCIVSAAPEFLFLSSSQQNYGEVVEGRPHGWAAQIESSVLASGQYRVFYEADDVVVLKNVRSEGAT